MSIRRVLAVNEDAIAMVLVGETTGEHGGLSEVPVAQMELFARHGSITGEEYGKQVYVLPKVLDEKVARLHLEALGAHLTELSKVQAEYLGVDVAGPYKPDHYRY